MMLDGNPILAMRGNCRFSRKSVNEERLSKHGSELDPQTLFVQETGAQQKNGGNQADWETVSIHQRITQNFEDVEDKPQAKSHTEVGSNYSYSNCNQSQSGQVMRAANNAYIPALHSIWVHIKGR